MPSSIDRAKVTAMKAAAKQWPILNAALNKIEDASHALELKDGRYAHLKYLEPVYRFYRKSKERRTRRRDKIRICKLRGLSVREGVCLFGVLILATTEVSKSTRGKYVAKLREALEKRVEPKEIRTFLRQPRKAERRERKLPSIVPRLRLVRSHRL